MQLPIAIKMGIAMLRVCSYCSYYYDYSMDLLKSSGAEGYVYVEVDGV